VELLSILCPLIEQDWRAIEPAWISKPIIRLRYRKMADPINSVYGGLNNLQSTYRNATGGIDGGFDSSQGDNAEELAEAADGVADRTNRASIARLEADGKLTVEQMNIQHSNKATSMYSKVADGINF
jgi:hypothetical protein